MIATKAGDLTLSFRVPRGAREVFDAINRVDAWWIGQVEGSFDTEGAEFTYAYEPYHRTVQRVTQLVPGKRIAWEVLESAIRFVDDGEEWKGTQITFDIAEKDGETEVLFKHTGLTPKLACFENCKAGWAHYVETSLPRLILTGQGVDPKF
jgi:hypothetical protein